ncbi:MAG: hypothetical protein ACUVWQ_09695, partial [Candidatus Aminicenantales bacterium]
IIKYIINFRLIAGFEHVPSFKNNIWSRGLKIRPVFDYLPDQFGFFIALALEFSRPAAGQKIFKILSYFLGKTGVSFTSRAADRTGSKSQRVALANWGQSPGQTAGLDARLDQLTFQRI